jgi:predicted HTH domain antitoxin
MGKTKAELEQMVIAKCNKAVLLFAKGYSIRQVGSTLHTDRHGLRRRFGGSVTKATSITFAEHIVADVIKHRLTYADVLRNYKVWGLKCLSEYHELIREKREKKLAVAIKDLRDSAQLPFSQIAVKLGIKQNAANEILRRQYGITKQANFRVIQSEKTALKVYKLWESGMSIKVIAEIVDLSPITIRHMLTDRFGVSLRRPPLIPFSELPRIARMRERLNWREIAYIYKVGAKSLNNFFYNNYVNAGGDAKCQSPALLVKNKKKK